jgi:tetratricopeptide (TPR) repeat protein
MKQFLCLLLIFSFSRSNGQNKSQIPGLIKEALAFEDSSDFANAIIVNKQIMAIDSNATAAANTIAGLYGKLGDFSSEIIWAQRAIDIDPEFMQGYINLGNAYAGQGDNETAAAKFITAEKLDHSSPLPPYSLGVIEESKNNYAMAAAYYEEAVARDPTFEDGFYNLAAVYANLKDFRKANKNIKKALILNPNAADAKQMQQHIQEALKAK